jgi:hypothetical protein
MGDYKNDAGSVNYNSYMAEPNARNKTLRTPMGTKLLQGNSAPPPVLGAPALSTSTNKGSQRGHGGKKYKA